MWDVDSLQQSIFLEEDWMAITIENKHKTHEKL
jgi:hypothetical protein